MKDTLTVELTEEEVSFLRELLFAYDDNAQSLDEMYLNFTQEEVDSFEESFRGFDVDFIREEEEQI